MTLRSAVSLLLVKPVAAGGSEEKQRTVTPAFG